MPTTTATLLGSPLLLHSYRRLAYNGGTTETMLPLTGSPALGAGLSSTLPTDQRGDPQPTGSGAVSDLGSVEVTP